MTSFEYPLTIHPLGEDEGGGYLIEFPDLHGCMSDGETPEEALSNGADALRCWIEAMREAGRPIPAPSRAPVGSRTVNIDDHIFHLLSEEAAQQGLSVESIANVALVSHALTVLNRSGNAILKRSDHAAARAQSRQRRRRL
jgi:antitoxin HicB